MESGVIALESERVAVILSERENMEIELGIVAELLPEDALPGGRVLFGNLPQRGGRLGEPLDRKIRKPGDLQRLHDIRQARGTESKPGANNMAGE